MEMKEGEEANTTEYLGLMFFLNHHLDLSSGMLAVQLVKKDGVECLRVLLTYDAAVAGLCYQPNDFLEQLLEDGLSGHQRALFDQWLCLRVWDARYFHSMQRALVDGLLELLVRSSLPVPAFLTSASWHDYSVRFLIGDPSFEPLALGLQEARSGIYQDASVFNPGVHFILSQKTPDRAIKMLRAAMKNLTFTLFWMREQKANFWSRVASFLSIPEMMVSLYPLINDLTRKYLFDLALESESGMSRVFAFFMKVPTCYRDRILKLKKSSLKEDLMALLEGHQAVIASMNPRLAYYRKSSIVDHVLLLFERVLRMAVNTGLFWPNSEIKTKHYMVLKFDRAFSLYLSMMQRGSNFLETFSSLSKPYFTWIETLYHCFTRFRLRALRGTGLGVLFSLCMHVHVSWDHRKSLEDALSQTLALVLQDCPRVFLWSSVWQALPVGLQDQVVLRLRHHHALWAVTLPSVMVRWVLHFNDFPQDFSERRRAKMRFRWLDWMANLSSSTRNRYQPKESRSADYAPPLLHDPHALFEALKAEKHFPCLAQEPNPFRSYAV